MEIILKGPACIAVDQGIMYAAIKGTQLGGDVGDLLVLIKSEYPTTVVANNIWSVISTAPEGYFSSHDSDWITQTSCNVDKNGVFTLRFFRGPGYRYDPTAAKSSKTQTCSSDSSGLGEWRRADLVGPYKPELGVAVVIQPEIARSSSNNGGYSEGDQMAIYYKSSSEQLLPTFHYVRIDKNADVTTITDKDLSQVSIGEKNMNYDILEYGDGHIAGRTIKTTLAYHPFEAPFPLTSPPNSTVYVPWVLGCDAPGSVKLGMAAKGKFYYICEVPQSLPFNAKIVMFIYDSKSRQTQGPFTLPNITNTISYT
ncbi:hypothetical protein BG005_010147 [Podila minutissima]|nr:hypothetical protein BG005_010147 [Podila minutissima]